MGLIVSESSQEFEKIPEGTYLGRSYILADLGTQKGFEGKPADKVAIAWELDEKMENGLPFTISKTYTASLNEKANLRKDLEAWRGRAFTPEELEEFNLVNILGKSCLINIIHKEKQNGKVGPSISSIMAVPRGMSFQNPHHAQNYFDVDNFDQTAFESLPEWMRTSISESPQYQALKAQGFAIDPLPSSEDLITEEEIPY